MGRISSVNSQKIMNVLEGLTRQYFVGKMDGRIVYNDKTDKTVKVYITKTVIDGRTRWTVLLGDIKVDATEP